MKIIQRVGFQNLCTFDLCNCLTLLFLNFLKYMSVKIYINLVVTSNCQGNVNLNNTLKN